MELVKLIFITAVDTLGISVPVGFMVSPSENSSSIENHLDRLKIEFVLLTSFKQ